ncbi:DUF55-domain-containing protein [Auriculariales sp. MPI-PUGE-AT-0066]|nr:DUF55-domain-containing protein [Auriculariales sp. MPI-PUGE-AT-0066]
MKAEPDSRVVKGKDVKFSVDDFETAGTTAWEGVRSYEARNIMRDRMKVGDKVLFYHSNCKLPGVAALAEVCKEAYPDYTAWDPKHPYYDEKTKQDDPKWYMVEVRFVSRVKHFIPLVVLKDLSDIDYLQKDAVDAIKSMALINKGRLSVQPVTKAAYEAILAMGEQGGFESEPTKPKASRKRKAEVAADVDANGEAAAEEANDQKAAKTKRKRR